jgi:hypothetical protein
MHFPGHIYKEHEKKDTHLLRSSGFDDLPPILVDLNLLLRLDRLFAISDCDQQKSTDGYWDRISVCRRPSPGVDELV